MAASKQCWFCPRRGTQLKIVSRYVEEVQLPCCLFMTRHKHPLLFWPSIIPYHTLFPFPNTCRHQSRNITDLADAFINYLHPETKMQGYISVRLRSPNVLIFSLSELPVLCAGMNICLDLEFSSGRGLRHSPSSPSNPMKHRGGDPGPKGSENPGRCNWLVAVADHIRLQYISMLLSACYRSVAYMGSCSSAIMLSLSGPLCYCNSMQTRSSITTLLLSPTCFRSIYTVAMVAVTRQAGDCWARHRLPASQKLGLGRDHMYTPTRTNPPSRTHLVAEGVMRDQSGSFLL